MGTTDDKRTTDRSEHLRKDGERALSQISKGLRRFVSVVSEVEEAGGFYRLAPPSVAISDYQPTTEDHPLLHCVRGEIPLEDLLGYIIGDFLIATELLDFYPTLACLQAASITDFMNVKGIGRRRAERLFAVMGLREKPEPVPTNTPISGPVSVYEIVERGLRGLKQERFLVMALDAKSKIVRIDTVSIGTLTASLVHPREVYRSAIVHGGSAIILVHNHPSGDPTPSREDIEITERLAEAGQMLGIDLLDHVVIGQGKYASLKEAGYL